MAFIHRTDFIRSDDSAIAHGVPLDERCHLPNNEPATYPNQDLAAHVDLPAPNPQPLNPPALNLPNHPQDQLPEGCEPIDPLLVEIPQRPYDNGLFHGDAPAQYISYGSRGFTVANVLDNDCSQVVDADDQIPTTEGRTWPTKMAFHFEFEEDAVYGAALHLPQQNVRMKRRGFALRAAEEIAKMLAKRPRFSFTLSQLKVVGIYVRSRGTVQARLCVSTDDWRAHLAKI